MSLKYYFYITFSVLLIIPATGFSTDNYPIKEKEKENGIKIANIDIQPEPDKVAQYSYERYEEKDNEHALDYIVVPGHNCTLPEWLIRSSLESAPQVLQGILAYLKTYDATRVIPSYHRFILVGEPGTGKTTLAQAFAHELGYQVEFISASSLLGKHRNHTAINIRNLFNTMRLVNTKKVIIIDELHKLFENYGSEFTDTYDNAMTFWTQLDLLETHNKNIIVIGTANRVDTLPPEIKSRFFGKIVTMPLPDKKQKLQALKDRIQNDTSIRIVTSNDFIHHLSGRLQSYSLRDIQLLVDTAKIFRYAEIARRQRADANYISQDMDNGCIELRENHFEQALNHLNHEPTRKSLYATMLPKIKEYGEVVGIAAQTVFLSSVCIAVLQQGYNTIPNIVKVLKTALNTE